MLSRTLKLKLTKKQEATFNEWLWHLTGVYNWAIRKIELDAKNKIYYSDLSFQNLLSGHSKRMGIPSHVLQGVLSRAYDAWERCFKKVAKKPHLKGKRNKLNSIPFPDPIKAPCENKISLPYLKHLRYFKQAIPEGKIKGGAVLKKASGWYLFIWIDTNNVFPVKDTNKQVGIDPGFSTLLTLSDGIKIENPRELRNGELRIGQASRGGAHRLVARLQEKQANRRKDRNHKISRKLIENYKTIYYSNDNFNNLSKRFNKSVSEASLRQLIRFINYKSSNCGREVKPINSCYTTMTCHSCGARSGPKGWDGLKVRSWECACGASHDRDVNAAMVVLKAGLGTSLKAAGDSGN